MKTFTLTCSSLLKALQLDNAIRMLVTVMIMNFSGYTGYGQLAIQANLPSVGFIQQTQLWNIVIVNSSTRSFECRITLSLTDRSTDAEILTATSGTFIVNAGVSQLNESRILPILYNYISPGMHSGLSAALPVGAYRVCYSLSAIVGERQLSFSENCLDFDVAPLSPPFLNYPADSTVSPTQPGQFGWLAPTPMNMFKELKYDIFISKINEHQNAREAIEENLPFYSESGILTNSINYGGNGLSFEKDKWYAWQVVARDNYSYADKSEVWVFKISNDSKMRSFTEASPFLKMHKQLPEKGIAKNGVLKLSYINETTDSSAFIYLLNRSGKKETKRFSAKLRTGENLLVFDVSKMFKLKEGIIYEAQIINSRKEIFSVLFEIQFYETNSQSKK